MPKFKAGDTVQRFDCLDPDMGEYYSGSKSFVLTQDSHIKLNVVYVRDPNGDSHDIEYIKLISAKPVRWQYEVRECNVDSAVYIANNWGNDGWELVSVVPVNMYGQVKLFLKRKV